MRYVVWAVRLIIFIAVLFFAYKNVTPVDLVFYNDVRLTGVPLIVVMLLTFIAGAVFGALLMIPGRWRRWREAGRLRRDLAKAKTKQPAAASGNQAEAGPSPL